VDRPLTVYVGKRLLLLIPTLLGVSVLTFLLIHLIPGDLVTILLGITASQNEQTRQALIHALHLDRPLAVQYLLWLGEVLRGDLGHSLVTGFSVRDELARSYPVTLQLALMAMSIALAVGVPLGVLAATRAGRALDASTRVFSLLFISAPAFFIGTVVIIGGARYAPWLPTLGHVPFTESPARSLGAMLPAAASLGLAISAIARFTRSSMLEVLGQDFVRTARAKGVADRAVVYKHALRNALIPVVAMAGTQFVYLIGGAVIIEEVFALPGMGRLVVNAIYQRDYTMIQGAILLLTSAAVLVNLALDLLYHLIDRRILYA
jgi:peptide/nickel transport system permease protein